MAFTQDKAVAARRVRHSRVNIQHCKKKRDQDVRGREITADMAEVDQPIISTTLRRIFVDCALSSRERSTASVVAARKGCRQAASSDVFGKGPEK